MAWIKRNLGLVIGGAVALALMALAGWYLYSKIQEESAVTAELEETTLKYTELLNRPVHPGNDKINNVELAKQENARLEEFLVKLRAQIVTPDVPKDLSNRDFRALLDNTITELQRDADRFGVNLPSTYATPAKDYWFTFQSQKTAVDFKNLPHLAHALMDIKAICQILYTAKVHDIIGIKRVPASSDETGADFFTDRKSVTNAYAITTPYEVTFQGFSSELAKVLEEFIKAKRCFIVKSVAMDKAPAASATSPMPMPSSNPMSRYGMRPSFAPPPPVTASVPTRGPAVILDESKLRFTLIIDSVRLLPMPEKKARPAAQPQPTAEG